MLYAGSKNRLGCELYDAISTHSGLTTGTWIEPFVGGGNMIQHVPASWRRIGFDANPHVVRLLQILSYRRIGKWWLDRFSKEEQIFKTVRRAFWNRRKENKDDDFVPGFAEVGFYGTHLSRNGDWFHSYRQEIGRDFVEEGVRHLAKQQEKIIGAKFRCKDYRNIGFASKNQQNTVFYCDPPYKGKKLEYCKGFNHDQFYDWCRMLSRCGYKVYISEMWMPEDFECIWEKQIRQCSNKKIVTERLYTI